MWTAGEGPVAGGWGGAAKGRHVMFVPPPDPQLKCSLAPPPCTSYGAAARTPRPALILILIVRLTLILIVCLAR